MGGSKKVLPLLRQLARAATPSTSFEPQIASNVTFASTQLLQTRCAAQAATAVASSPPTVKIEIQPLAFAQVPAVTTDLYGAVSAVTEGSRVEQGVYKNVDGHR